MSKVSARVIGVTKITSKGQVTIPQSIRRSLSLKTGDSLVVDLEKNKVNLTPLPRKSLEEIYGSLPVQDPINFKKVRKAFKEEVAKRHSR